MFIKFFNWSIFQWHSNFFQVQQQPVFCLQQVCCNNSLIAKILATTRFLGTVDIGSINRDDSGNSSGSTDTALTVMMTLTFNCRAGLLHWMR